MAMHYFGKFWIGGMVRYKTETGKYCPFLVSVEYYKEAKELLQSEAFIMTEASCFTSAPYYGIDIITSTSDSLVTLSIPKSTSTSDSLDDPAEKNFRYIINYFKGGNMIGEIGQGTYFTWCNDNNRIITSWATMY